MHYFVFAIYANKNIQDVYEYLSALSGENDYCYIIKKDIVIYFKGVEVNSKFSAHEIGESIAENIFREIGTEVKVCISGICANPDKFLECSAHTINSLISGVKAENSKTVFSSNEFLLEQIIGELPANVIAGYKKELCGQAMEILKDKELMQTAECFFAHSLNASETARALFIHRNTLSYRIEKIIEICGLNIANFSDALTLRIMSAIYRG